MTSEPIEGADDPPRERGVTDSDRGVAPEPSRWRRIARGIVLGLGGVLTGVCAVLLVACLLDDHSINSHRATATAEVLDTSFTRTAVSFTTPDGQNSIPAAGVQYASGLHEGDLVRVEYDAKNPKLARVAGRGTQNAVLPVLGFVVAVWVVVLGGWWALRDLGPDGRRRPLRLRLPGKQSAP